MPELLASEPIDFLLKCFNALKPAVAEHPDKILDELKDHRRAALEKKDTTSSSAAQNFDESYSNQQSTQSAYAEAALSFGLSGSYGPYSGSCQASMQNERESASEEINGTLTAVASRGTLAFKSDKYTDIRAHLAPELLEDLDKIDSFVAAEKFTNDYGTHLVTGVKLGGTLTLVVKVTSRSLSEKLKLATEVEAAYKGIGSMEATAKASKKVSEMSSAKSLSQRLQVMGGTLDSAASINMEDSTTIKAWVNTCGEESVSGLSSAVELYTLAEGKEARKILKHYLDLCLLKHSIENPVVFSAMAPINEFEYNSLSTTADKDYKIISGGAWLDKNSSDFLTASYPDFHNGVINAWQATSHDCKIKTASGSELVGYAIGVHDPAELLSVYCDSADGANPIVGADTAVQTLSSGYVLTGGGCQTSTNRNEPRYLTGSYPKCLEGKTYNSWVADGHDYGYESSATLKAWAIGIRLQDTTTNATISHRVIKQEGGLQSHGTSIAVLGGQASIAGGGVQLSENKENLIHASFPAMQSNQMGWQEFNGDLDNVVDQVVATAYAITLQLTSTDPDVTFRPYGRKAAAERSAAH